MRSRTRCLVDRLSRAGGQSISSVDASPDFRRNANFSLGPFLAKCKISLRGPSTGERGFGRGTGGAIRSLSAIPSQPCSIAGYGRHAKQKARRLNRAFAELIRSAWLTDLLLPCRALSAKPRLACQERVALRRRGSRLACVAFFGRWPLGHSPLGAGRF